MFVYFDSIQKKSNLLHSTLGSRLSQLLTTAMCEQAVLLLVREVHTNLTNSQLVVSWAKLACCVLHQSPRCRTQHPPLMGLLPAGSYDQETLIGCLALGSDELKQTMSRAHTPYTVITEWRTKSSFRDVIVVSLQNCLWWDGVQLKWQARTSVCNVYIDSFHWCLKVYRLAPPTGMDVYVHRGCTVHKNEWKMPFQIVSFHWNVLIFSW